MLKIRKWLELLIFISFFDVLNIIGFIFFTIHTQRWRLQVNDMSFYIFILAISKISQFNVSWFYFFPWWPAQKALISYNRNALFLQFLQLNLLIMSPAEWFLWNFRLQFEWTIAFMRVFVKKHNSFGSGIMNANFLCGLNW